MNFLYQLPEEQILMFGLVLFRVAAFILAMPVVGTSSVPAPLKILLSLVVAIIIFPIAMTKVKIPVEAFSDQLIVLGIKESLVGLFLGFFTRFFFFSLNIAGEMVSVSSGISTAQMFDPTLSQSSSAIENLHVMMGTLLFFVLNGHHVFFQGLALSFETLPITKAWFNIGSMISVQEYVGQIILIGLKLSSPVWISVLLANLALALLGRAVPFLNVFSTSFHVTILLAFGVLFISMPLISEEIGNVLGSMTQDFFLLVRSL